MTMDSHTRGNTQPQQSQRQLRVGEQIRHCLVEIFRDGHFRDPDLAQVHLVTVTEVRISADLKNATAFVMPLGGAALEKTVGALNRAVGYIRGELSRAINLRYTPKITFVADTSFQRAEKIGALLDTLPGGAPGEGA